MGNNSCGKTRKLVRKAIVRHNCPPKQQLCHDGVSVVLLVLLVWYVAHLVRGHLHGALRTVYEIHDGTNEEVSVCGVVNTDELEEDIVGELVDLGAVDVSSGEGLA